MFLFSAALGLENLLRFIRKGSSLCLNPFKGFTLRSESFEGCRGPNNCFLKVPSVSLYGGTVIMERICAKDHGSLKCPPVEPFKILHSEGPFEVASFEHFGLERPFNLASWLFSL